MAEPVVKISQEDKISGERKEEEEEEEEEIRDENMCPLAGLNLVLILSFLSLSAEECANLGEFEDRENAIDDHKAKRSVLRSNLPIRRRELNEFRASGKQTSKIHTKIRECGHCRRM